MSLEEEQMKSRGLSVGARKKLLGLKRQIMSRAREHDHCEGGDERARKKRLVYVGQVERREAARSRGVQLTLREEAKQREQEGCSQLELALALSASLQAFHSDIESDLSAKRELANILQEACRGGEVEVSRLELR